MRLSYSIRSLKRDHDHSHVPLPSGRSEQSAPCALASFRAHAGGQCCSSAAGRKQHANANTMQMRCVMNPHRRQVSFIARSRTHDPRCPPPLPLAPNTPVTLQVESCVISSPSLLVCVVCVVGDCVDKKITGLQGAFELIRMRITWLLGDKRMMWLSRCSLNCMTIHLHSRGILWYQKHLVTIVVSFCFRRRKRMC